MQRLWPSIPLLVAAPDTLKVCSGCGRRFWQEGFPRSLRQLGGVLFWVGVGLVCGQAGASAQTDAPAAEPVPVIAAPPPPPQEQRLTPIPQSFDWMNREVQANPLLETLVSLQARRARLLLSVTLGAEYSDNFSPSGSDSVGLGEEETGTGEEEYRTSLSVSTAYRLESGPSFIALANTVSANYDIRAEDTEIGFANLSANAGHRIGRLALALSESLRRDDDTGTASSAGIRRQRRTFLRNAVSPQARYTLSPLTAVDLTYTNTLALGEEEEEDDGLTVTHTVRAGLQHRFSRLLQGAFAYSFTTGNSQDAADTLAHNATADLGYRFDRLTSMSLRGFGRITDRSNGGFDSQLYGFNVGVRRQFTSFLTLFASIGPTLLEREGRDQRMFVNWQASLDGAFPISRRASLTLTTQQSVSDTASDVDDVGLVRSQSVALSLNYLITQYVLAVLSGSYVRTEFLEDVGSPESVPGRKDNFWRGGVTVTYALSRTLSLAAGYLYQRRDSNLADSDFDENRVTLTLSSNFTVF